MVLTTSNGNCRTYTYDIGSENIKKFKVHERMDMDMDNIKSVQKRSE